MSDSLELFKARHRQILEGLLRRHDLAMQRATRGDREGAETMHAGVEDAARDLAELVDGLRWTVCTPALRQ